MDVSVLSKNGQRSLRSSVRSSVLGDGLLERTRSTSLALLGLTAAIGLAMVALALNQGWPLIAGAPIPGFESEHQGVGKAMVAARAKPRSRGIAISGPPSQVGRRVSSGESGSRSGKTALSGSQAPQAAGLVVSHPTATTPTGGGLPNGTPPSPAPVAQQVAQTPAPTPASAPASNSSSNTSPSNPVAGNAPASPIPSQTPPASSEGDEHGHGHTGQGHAHSHSGNVSDTSESSESPEESPAPSEASPPEADEPEDEQSHAPSWSHGGGHGYGHEHGHW